MHPVKWNTFTSYFFFPVITSLIRFKIMELKVQSYWKAPFPPLCLSPTDTLKCVKQLMEMECVWKTYKYDWILEYLLICGDDGDGRWQIPDGHDVRWHDWWIARFFIHTVACAWKWELQLQKEHTEAFWLSPSLSGGKLCQLDGNSKNMAMVCFIIEEMESRRGLCLADNGNEPRM